MTSHMINATGDGPKARAGGRELARRSVMSLTKRQRRCAREREAHAKRGYKSAGRAGVLGTRGGVGIRARSYSWTPQNTPAASHVA